VRDLTQQPDKNVLFDTLMLGIADQAFLLDAESMQVLKVSQSVYQALDCALPELQKKDLQTILGVTKEALTAYMSSHHRLAEFALSKKSELNQAKAARFYRLDHLNITVIESGEKQYLFAIKQVASLSIDENDTRFKVLVQNTLGLVLEFQRNTRGDITFGYLSDGCRALLGIDAYNLKQAPDQFFEFMDKGDRALLEAKISESAASLSILNWDGRFWIDEWQDIKWVNIRSSPRRLASGAIQWSGIMTNITQGKSEQIELEQSRQRLAGLSAHLNLVKEQERTRIAREIHDDLGGNLTVIKMGLASLMKHLPEGQQSLIEKIQDLKSIVDETFETVHRISGDLRPNILELGIVAALEWQTKEFSKKMEIPCHFVTNKQVEKGTPEQAITLFRVCQEAMSNIAKYAQARRVDVALFFDQDAIKMMVIDDGVGINAGVVMKPDAFGLRGMEERVAALNGEFSIERTGTHGTRVTAILPNIRPDALAVEN
jgi:two-component system sensor histidine kinase UhpB